MTHSLIIEEVLAHPQDISWLPWAVQYFFFIGIAACASGAVIAQVMAISNARFSSVAASFFRQ